MIFLNIVHLILEFILSFGDEESKAKATPKIFELCGKFRLPPKLTDHLFSAGNLWPSLEFALQQPLKESVLLQKCLAMLQSNKTVYSDTAKVNSTIRWTMFRN
jgi:hypothetical protein